MCTVYTEIKGRVSPNKFIKYPNSKAIWKEMGLLIFCSEAFKDSLIHFFGQQVVQSIENSFQFLHIQLTEIWRSELRNLKD